MELQETITALVTPFSGGEVDFDGLKRNIEFQIAGGVTSLLLLGSTGEMHTLTKEERETLVPFVKEVIADRVSLMVNVSSSATTDAVQFAKYAEEKGADTLLLSPPPYLCPSEDGIIAHFEEVLKATSLPVMLYNIPKRVTVSITENIAKHFSGTSNILGVKEASGSLQTMLMLSQYMPIYAGNDAEYIAARALGAKGVVSVISNLDPGLIVELTKTASCALQEQVLQLSNILSCGPNPVAIKAAMNLRGMAAGDVRLPLTPLSENAKNTMAEKLGVATV